MSLQKCKEKCKSIHDYRLVDMIQSALIVWLTSQRTMIDSSELPVIYLSFRSMQTGAGNSEIQASIGLLLNNLVLSRFIRLLWCDLGSFTHLSARESSTNDSGNESLFQRQEWIPVFAPLRRFSRVSSALCFICWEN